MQPEPASKTSSPRRKYFFYGVIFELLLIASCFLSDSWLVVETRNFFIITHTPLLLLTEGLRSEAFGLAGFLFIIGGLVLMAWVWGFSLRIILKGVSLIVVRLNSRQRRFGWLMIGVGSLAGFGFLVFSALAQMPRPFATTPEIQSVVEANNAFALDLYQKLKTESGNVFISPFSISSALAMTSVGARGQTEAEMTNVLHYGLPPKKLHPAFKSLMARLAGLQRWNRIELDQANSLWGQKDYSFTPDFLKVIQENYSAQARAVDFINSRSAAADEMSRWIDTQTKHKIPAAIAPEQLTENTRLALVNTIYFKGDWQYQFKKKDTKPSPFQITTNETVTVPMMWQSAPFKHAMTEDDSVEMLELPYVGQDLSMVILMPWQSKYATADEDRHDLAELEAKLTNENLRSWLKVLDGKNPHKTSVSLPRFTTKSSFNLVNALKSLGMASAFSNVADFSGMDGSKNLYLSDVLHQSFVEVNETGTEAAAMTIALVKTKGMDDRCIVDHPFLFLIRDNGSGSILFLGRIMNPTK